MRAKLILISVLLFGCANQETETVAPESDEQAPIQAVPDMGELASDDIGLMARVHFATHTVDFDRARAFYRTLGYTEGVTGFPLTNTHLMARSLGMFDECQYELAKGEVMSLPGSPNPASIDLLQFKTPFNDEPPYELPNHLGMAYAVFATADFDADYATLMELGAEFLSAPYRGDSTFVFFRDPDGVLYKLVAMEGGQVSGEGMHIFDMPLVAINVSDLDKSLEFWARLGYQPASEPSQREGSPEEGRAHGLEGGFTVRTVDIAITRGDEHRLSLTQWLQPFDDEPPYPPPINHIGINRVAVLVRDLDRAVGILKAQDVPILSEVAPCCSGTEADETGIVHAIDPDGIFVELVGGIERRPLVPQPTGCPPLEIKYPPGDSDYSSGRLLSD